MSTTEKLISTSLLAERSAALRAQGKSIVSVNGVFDLLSVPHVLLLERAKREGDVLFVGINSDRSVRALKGPTRPIMPEHDRALLVAALACTDYVFLFDDLDPRPWLPLVHPTVHVNSAEYSDQCIEASTLRTMGAKLVLVPRDTLHRSTSQIIDTIQRQAPSACSPQ